MGFLCLLVGFAGYVAGQAVPTSTAVAADDHEMANDHPLNVGLLYDTEAPTVTLSSNKDKLGIGETATITVTFSEAVNGVGSGDFGTSVGVINNFSGNDGDSEYTFAISTVTTENKTSLSIFFIDVPGTNISHGITDLAGNALSGQTGFTDLLTIDNIRPTATITANDTEDVSGPTELTIEWSEDVEGFEVGDVGVSGDVGSSVSNLGQSDDSSTGVIIIFAQKFTTGPGDSDHALQSVQLDYKTVPSNLDDLTVTIREADSNNSSNPSNTVLHTLTNPATLVVGTNTFTAPANATLATGTDYFVHSSYPDSNADNLPIVNVTSAEDEDSGASTGWSIADSYRFYTGASWAPLTGILKIAVNATATNTPTPGTITDLTGSGASYTATYTPPGPGEAGTDRIRIAAGAVQDDHGNDNAATDVLTITYDTNSGITLSETALSVDEGGTVAYDVVLDTQPTADVTVTIASDDADAVTVSPGMLTFTAGNWDMAQEITLTGVDDANDAYETVTISHETASTDGNYTIMDAGTVDVTTNDDDVTLIITAEPSIAVEGSEVIFTFTLSAPLAEGFRALYTNAIDGYLGFAYNVGEDLVNTTMLTMPEDADTDDGTFVLPPFDNITNELVTITYPPAVTVIDDDRDAGVILSETTGIAAENGGMVTYTVVLEAAPSADVVITPESGAIEVATVSGALTFTDNDWFMPQHVTVTGVDDDVFNATDRIAAINHAIATNDSDYGALTGPVYTFTAEDDELPPYGIALSETDLSINEGETATYTIVLASQPTDVVTVTPESNDIDAITVSGALMFTDNDWNMPQTVTITGELDADGDDATVMISHSAASDDGNYVIMDAGTVEVTVTDVNSAPSVPILAENANAPSSVSYGNDILTISAVIAADDALLTAESTDPDGDDVTYRLEPVAPSDDGLLDTLQIDENTGIITLKVDLTASNNDQHAFKVVASDGNFDVETEKQVLVIDIAPNVALSETDLSINEGETATYTIMLASQPTDVVTVTPKSGNTDAVTVSGALMFTDNDWNMPQTVTITGEFDADGDDTMAMISHSTASDDGNYVIMDAGTVEVNVTDVNSAPSVPILAENVNIPSGVSYSSNIVTISEDVSMNDALITAESTDSDGDDVTYRLEAVAPSGVGLLDTLQIDENTGIITLKVDLTASNNDQHAFKVVASDENFDVETEKQTFVIDIDAIEPPNEAPSVPTLAKSANSPDGVGYSNGILTISAAISVNDALITAESIDPEGNSVSYLLESVAPSGIGLLDTLEMDANTGIITLKVALTAANNGMHTFKVVASDGKLSVETEIQVLAIDIEVDEPVLGLSDADGYVLYPNPVGGDGFLHIHSVLVGDMMEIVDLEGHLLVNQTVRSVNEQVSVSNLSAGTYLLIITSANGNGIASKVLPFIKE